MTKWKNVSEDRYYEMLEVLPPAVMTGNGFMVGEPWTHRTCTVTNKMQPTFQAFVEIRGKHYEAQSPMTIPEFRKLKMADVLGNMETAQ